MFSQIPMFQLEVRLEEVLFLMKCKRYYECLWNEDIYVMSIYIPVTEFHCIMYLYLYLCS